MMEDTPIEEGKSEVRIKLEREARKRKERAEEEWREYEMTRQAEREKEEEEIKKLRERRQQRKMEREEEEKKLSEQRAVEEQKRRAEDEERIRKRKEEEQARREECERKREAIQEKSKDLRPNFVITKKGAFVEIVEEVKKEEVTKSKEQLEAERKAILEQRIPPLSIEALKADQLRTKAKELLDHILRLESDKYDLEQRFTRQNYDMQELSERARQMNKGDKKQKQVQNAPDPLVSKISGIPPKVSMYSEYERVKDHRSFGERRTVFVGPQFVERYEKIEPSQTVIMTEEGFQVEGAANPRIRNGSTVESSVIPEIRLEG